jgi:stage II sporulation protein D
MALCFSLCGAAQVMEIGIQRDLTVSRFVFKASAPATIRIDTASFVLNPGEVCYVARNGSAVVAESGTRRLTGAVLDMMPAGHDAWFGITITGYQRKERQYHGWLRVDAVESALRLVNHVPLNQYLCGVVQAESGVNQNLEYYKVQAILARTYALKNQQKHRDEGFMLTDLVNCQAYHGRCTHPEVIGRAVEESSGMVVTDAQMELITAVYHSNSGGQTANPEHVWHKPIPYLRSVVDTFSIGATSYRWTKTFTEAEWLGYLASKFGYPTGDSVARVKALNYKQVFRQAFFVDPAYGIPLRDIRMDLKLNSTFFSITPENGKVILKGKGFGHGVGLSQEGAMAMSKKGYNHQQIIQFYFQDVRIVHLRTMLFFRDQGEATFAQN